MYLSSLSKKSQKASKPSASRSSGVSLTSAGSGATSSGNLLSRSAADLVGKLEHGGGGEFGVEFNRVDSVRGDF
jgi:hypothetical protein